MPKYVLDADYDYDFSLLALSAHIPDYKISIEINHLLGIDLGRDPAIELSNKSIKTPLLFSCFGYVDEEEQAEFILLSNKSSNSVSSIPKTGTPTLFKEEQEDTRFLLIPELGQADFLLLLKADNHSSLANDILNKLKTVTFVLSVQAINPETLHSKKNLII